MTTNRKLGIIALILGALALTAGDSLRSSRVSVDPKELASRIQHELDHVDPQELAEWIAEKKEGYRLIDLRSEPEFSLYHIPGAERMDLPALMDSSFDKQETLVVYSQGGVHSAQAMFLLWAKGHDKTLMLKGGISAWEADVLHRSPSLHPPDSTSGKQKLPKKPLGREEENFRREC